ncbi:MAG: RES family NAD+ phosphorylase, partial [Giesbergeria sp.]
FCQAVGSRIHREGHPGLLTQSVRRPAGENLAIFNPAVLSNPRHNCQLTYRLEGGQIVVEKQPGAAWIALSAADL